MQETSQMASQTTVIRKPMIGMNKIRMLACTYLAAVLNTAMPTLMAPQQKQRPRNRIAAKTQQIHAQTVSPSQTMYSLS